MDLKITYNLKGNPNYVESVVMDTDKVFLYKQVNGYKERQWWCNMSFDEKKSAVVDFMLDYINYNLEFLE